MPKKILLVEDDRKMLDFMRRYLENRRLHKGGGFIGTMQYYRRFPPSAGRLAGAPVPYR